MAAHACLLSAKPVPTGCCRLARKVYALPTLHRPSRRCSPSAAKDSGVLQCNLQLKFSSPDKFIEVKGRADTEEDLLRSDLERQQSRSQAGTQGQGEPKLVFSRRVSGWRRLHHQIYGRWQLMTHMSRLLQGGQRAGDEATGLQGITNKVLPPDNLML